LLKEKSNKKDNINNNSNTISNLQYKSKGQVRGGTEATINNLSAGVYGLTCQADEGGICAIA
jgi:hypothetical protein